MCGERRMNMDERTVAVVVGVLWVVKSERRVLVTPIAHRWNAMIAGKIKD